MKRLTVGTQQIVILAVVLMSIPGDCSVSALSVESSSSGRVQSEAFAGSSSCRQCHERFYKLWAPSHHGLAMQPYTAVFAKANLIPQAVDIKIGRFRYRAEIETEKGWVREIGPEGQRCR
ncbi:MAG: hypothetical protein ACXACF_09110 [Candidatus Hermodarchaeia archaeon]|jgi:hypothetical protein